MIKKYIFIVLFFPSILLAQSERFPVFDLCKGNQIKSLKECFYNTAKKHFYAKFKTPPIVENENFKGKVNILFAVTKEGNFKLIYINTPYNELKTEIKNAFKVFPKITPAWYNNHAIEMQFILPISFPLDKETDLNAKETNTKKEDLFEVVEKNRIADSTFLEHNSQLNIPFTHQRYVDFEFALHKKKRHTYSL